MECTDCDQVVRSQRGGTVPAEGAERCGRAKRSGEVLESDAGGVR